jgi:Flp pilus assembly protein TadB
MSSPSAERAGGGGEIEPRDSDQRPRPQRRGDGVARAADDEHVAVASLAGVGARRQRRGRAAAHVGVAGEQRAAAVEDRRAAHVDRQRRDPRERAVRRERRARHREPREADRSPAVGTARDNARVTFIRIAWLATVLACVITGVVLLVSGYQGYAAVFGAVGACAAINLR